MQKLIYLLLFTLIACGEKKDDESTTTNLKGGAYLLRKEGNAYSHLKSDEVLKTSDVVYFSEQDIVSLQNKDISLEKFIQKNLNLSVQSTCKSQEKTFKQDFQITSNQFDVIDVLPSRLFLSSNKNAECTFDILVTISGVVRLFSLENRKVDFSLYFERKFVYQKIDDKNIKHINQDVLLASDQTLLLNSSDAKNLVEVNCEGFQASLPSKFGENLLLEELLNKHVLENQIDFLGPMESFKDSRRVLTKQKCIFSLETQSGIQNKSKVYDVLFQPLEPKITLNVVGRGNTYLYYVYDAYFYNYHEVPITIAIPQAMLIPSDNNGNVSMAIEGDILTTVNITNNSIAVNGALISFIVLKPNGRMKLANTMGLYAGGWGTGEQYLSITPFFSLKNSSADPSDFINFTIEDLARKIPIEK